MDWGFLDIFKKAEFNTLMLSIAITGWILYIFASMNIYILGAAILSSVYCIIRLIVYTYHYLLTRLYNKNYEAQLTKEEEARKAEQRKAREIEISRMFEGLKEDNRKLLAYVLLKGKKDSFKINVLHFDSCSSDYGFVQQAVYVSRIFKDAIGCGDDCIWIKHYTDTFTATIDIFLYEVIKQYIEENGLDLINQNKT